MSTIWVRQDFFKIPLCLLDKYLSSCRHSTILIIHCTISLPVMIQFKQSMLRVVDQLDNTWNIVCRSGHHTIVMMWLHWRMQRRFTRLGLGDFLCEKMLGVVSLEQSRPWDDYERHGMVDSQDLSSPWYGYKKQGKGLRWAIGLLNRVEFVGRGGGVGYSHYVEETFRCLNRKDIKRNRTNMDDVGG